MKKVFCFFVLIGMIVSIQSCKQEEEKKGEPDPPGTITTVIRNDDFAVYIRGVPRTFGDAYVGIGTIRMNYLNIFSFGGGIAYVGNVNGLGSIKSLPEESEFISERAVNEGGGYVLRATNTNNETEYARLYVSRVMIGANSGKIIGAELKYQYPFVP